MRAALLALLGLLLLASAPTRAQEEKRIWRLTEEAGEARLHYGTDNAEDTPIVFSCKAKRTAVTVWINETGKGVKPNRAMTAELTAGSATAKVKGKTLPNEEAGTPSFRGASKISEPLFAALGKEKSLVMVVGPSRETVPLADIGDKAEKFAKVCGGK